MDELPETETQKLKRFVEHGYDSELGWIRKPNTKGHELGLTVGEELNSGVSTTTYHINAIGARKNPGHEHLNARVSSYGDSFVFGRQVNDNQTFQWYLSKFTQSNVLNFGVGNYGFDQAFIRLKREYHNNPTDIVIIGVVPETIVRILSVWKHYYEYGYLLGFKPRFVLDDNNLKLISNPIDQIEKFSKIEQHIDRIKKNDFFYKYKFQKDLLDSPYLLSIFKNPLRNIPLIFFLCLRKQKLLKKVGGVSIQNYPWKLILGRNFKIVRNLYNHRESVTLFLTLIDEYINFAVENNFKPILLFMPYRYDISYIRENEEYYSEFINQVEMKMLTIDLTKYLLGIDNIDKLYSSDFYGGHFTPKGNQFVAEIIEKNLDISFK